MSDPSNNLTFSKLRIRVAEYLGIAYYGAAGGEAAQLPTDAHDLDLVGRLVNDGYDRFITDNERGWRFMTVPLSITFAPQSSVTITVKTTGTATVGSLAGDFADDYFNGWQIGLKDEDAGGTTALTVVDYTGATGLFTFAASSVPSTIEAGDTLLYAGSGNVAGDAARYFLPDDSVGIINFPWTYPETGPLVRIDRVTEARMRELRAATSSTSGDATLYATRAINTTATSTGKRWEVIFWPTPSGTETITTTYKRSPQALSDTGDLSVAGPQHDRSVLAAALAAAEIQRDDKVGPREAAYQSALARSMKLDDRTAPESLGDYGDKGETGGIRRRFSLDYDGTEVLP